ncbi:MAG: hypothetical protein ACREFR_19315 [Limisphaerales bacterium]
MKNSDVASPFKRRRLQYERFMEELYRSPRERHTQKQFVPTAMKGSLQVISRGKRAIPRLRPKSGRTARRVPSTLLLNRGNVRRKPAARGRTQGP